ncbi:MAG: bifunctional methionine sulfoxide reductase B/A protein [Helicobacteraceae bacterium]
MDFKKLTPEEEYVIVHKGTEKPFSGKYHDAKNDGIYTCKRCGTSLFRSKDKFDSKTGYPSFDAAIEENVALEADESSRQTEILCDKCRAHLGFLYKNEGFTPCDLRFSVNSIALDFVMEKGKLAYFAGGSFWDLEYYFRKRYGVLGVTSGYSGGHTKNPSYDEICYDDTGYLETVRVEYNPKQTDFEKLARYFFEIHDPSAAPSGTINAGAQYASAVFYTDDEQKKTIETLFEILRKNGIKPVTQLLALTNFYEAESYHQNYYLKNKKQPHANPYKVRFLDV